jgi:hypothetical protein
VCLPHVIFQTLALLLGSAGVLLVCVGLVLLKRARPLAQLFLCGRAGPGERQPGPGGGDMFKPQCVVPGDATASGSGRGGLGTLAMAGSVKEWTPRSRAKKWVARLTNSGKVRRMSAPRGETAKAVCHIRARWRMCCLSQQTLTQPRAPPLPGHPSCLRSRTATVPSSSGCCMEAGHPGPTQQPPQHPSDASVEPQGLALQDVAHTVPGRASGTGTTGSGTHLVPHVLHCAAGW